MQAAKRLKSVVKHSRHEFLNALRALHEFEPFELVLVEQVKVGPMKLKETPKMRLHSSMLSDDTAWTAFAETVLRLHLLYFCIDRPAVPPPKLISVRRKKRGLPCFVEQTGDTWRPKIGGEEESGWFTGVGNDVRRRTKAFRWQQGGDGVTLSAITMRKHRGMRDATGCVPSMSGGLLASRIGGLAVGRFPSNQQLAQHMKITPQHTQGDVAFQTPSPFGRGNVPTRCPTATRR